MSVFQRNDHSFPKQIWFAIGAFVLILVLGSIGYMTIEGWGFFDSLYMTIISLSTVGFNEVHTLSNAGRVVTIVVIVLGIGVGGYAIGNISAFLVGGEIQKIMRGRRRSLMLERIKDHVIICGYGKIGRQAAQDLKANQRLVVVIDSNPNTLARAEEDGFLVVKGDATDDETLLQSRVEFAKSILCALSGDHSNLVVALTARNINPNIFIVARGTDETSEKLLIRAGANRVILPYNIGGKRMASMVIRPDVVDFLDVAFHDEELNLRLEELEIGEGCPWDGKTLLESRIRQSSRGAWVMGVRKPGKKLIVNPPTDTLLNSGDRLVVLGNDAQLDTLKNFKCVLPTYPK